MLIQECTNIELLNKMLESARIQTKRIVAIENLNDPEIGKQLAEISYEMLKIKIRLEELGQSND